MNLEERYTGAIIKCSEHGFTFNQSGSMVMEEGGEAHAINLCKLWYIERSARQGIQPVKAAEWREIADRKAYLGRLWEVSGMEQLMRGM